MSRYSLSAMRAQQHRGARAESLEVVCNAPPVPSQMGVMLRSGKVPKDKRVHQWQEYIALECLAAINRTSRDGLPWIAAREDRFAVELEFYVEDEVARDLDNLCKAFLDGAKRLVFPDDSQVVDLSAKKRIDREHPRAIFRVRRVS